MRLISSLPYGGYGIERDKTCNELNIDPLIHTILLTASGVEVKDTTYVTGYARPTLRTSIKIILLSLYKDL